MHPEPAQLRMGLWKVDLASLELSTEAGLGKQVAATNLAEAVSNPRLREVGVVLAGNLYLLGQDPYY